MFTKTRRYPPVFIVAFFLAAYSVVFTDPRPALADPLIPFPITMPNTVAEFLTMTGGSVGEVGVSATAVGSLGPTAVALGGLATGYGIGMGLRKGFSMVWHWASGHSSGYADNVTWNNITPAANNGQWTTADGTVWTGHCKWASNLQVYYPSVNHATCNAQGADNTATYPSIVWGGGSVSTNPGWTTSPAAVYQVTTYADGHTVRIPATGNTPVCGAYSCSNGLDPSITWNRSATAATRPIKSIVYSAATGGNSSNPFFPGEILQAIWVTSTTTQQADPTAGLGGSTAITTTPTRQCTDANGNVTTVTGTPFHYTDGQDGDTLPSIQVPDCPAGTYGTKFTTPSTRDSDGASVQSPIPDWTAPANYMPTAGFPLCPLPDSCVMTLIKHNPDNTLTNCTGTIACQGWHDWPKSGPTISIQTVPSGANATEPARINAKGEYVTCQWGPYTLSSDECVDVATEPANPPAPADGSITNCLSGAISWNPIDWVFVPVKCVLTWAFEPTPTQMTTWQVKATSIASHPPVNIMTGGVAYISSVYNIWSACLPTCAGDGTTYGFPVPGEPPGTVFDPIGSAGNTMQTDPKGQTIYAVMQVAIIGGFAWWAWRRIASSFGGKETTA